MTTITTTDTIIQAVSELQASYFCLIDNKPIPPTQLLEITEEMVRENQDGIMSISGVALLPSGHRVVITWDVQKTEVLTSKEYGN